MRPVPLYAGLCLHTHTSTLVVQLEQTKSELNIMKKVCHKNVVRYLGSHLDEGTKVLNIFVEYMPQGSIATVAYASVVPGGCIAPHDGHELKCVLVSPSINAPQLVSSSPSTPDPLSHTCTCNVRWMFWGTLLLRRAQQRALRRTIWVIVIEQGKVCPL